jgi:hypothetical protein
VNQFNFYYPTWRALTFKCLGTFFTVVEHLWLARESEMVVSNLNSSSKVVLSFTSMWYNKGLLLGDTVFEKR